MRRLAWLWGAFLGLAACSGHPFDPTSPTSDAAAGQDGPHRATGSAGATGAGDAGAGAAGTTSAAGTTGGAAGTTGVAGTGAAGAQGAAGTKGAAGTSATGAAGKGGAGAPGSDGGIDRPGDAGDVCRGLESDYAAALVEAKSCNPALNRLTCQEQVDTSLACATCKAWVDDKTHLDAVRADWKAAGCDKPPRLCPAIKCVNPGVGRCVPDKMGGGTCARQLLTPVPL